MSIRDYVIGGGEGDPREERCRRLIERCGYGAAALTILPIPGSEIIGVMPLHVGMVIGLGEEHGVRLTRASATELVLRIGATVGLSLVGSKLATTAGKLILPGFGGLIAAPFMYASTLAIGRVAMRYFESSGQVTDDEMRRIFKDTVDRAKKAFDPAKARSADARAVATDAAQEGEHADESGGGAPSDAERYAGESVDDLAERLAKVTELKDKGLISDAEYEATKARILDSI